jgi:predicted helicase
MIKKSNLWWKRFEKFTEVFLSSVEGFTSRGSAQAKNIKTGGKEHDYDLIFLNKSILREELGNYMLVECKFWKKKVGYPNLAKFFHKLHTKRCSTGILFTMRGIKDDKRNTTLREIYDNDNIIVIVFDKTDIENVLLENENLVSLIRKKYEQVRFRLP